MFMYDSLYDSHLGSLQCCWKNREKSSFLYVFYYVVVFCCMLSLMSCHLDILVIYQFSHLSNTFAGDVLVVCSILVGWLVDNSYSCSGRWFQQAEPHIQRPSPVQPNHRHCRRHSGFRHSTQMSGTVSPSCQPMVPCVMEGEMVCRSLLGLPNVSTCKPSVTAKPRPSALSSPIQFNTRGAIHNGKRPNRNTPICCRSFGVRAHLGRGHVPGFSVAFTYEVFAGMGLNHSECNCICTSTF
jgi:hypothetical protein